MNEGSLDKSDHGFAFDGSIEAWIEVIQKSGAGQHGDVLMLFSERRAIYGMMMKWVLATQLIVGERGESAYTDFCVIMPPSHAIYSAILREAASNAGISTVTFVELVTAERDHLHSAIVSQPERSAICILGTEVFRVNGIDNTSDVLVSSWTGISHGMQSIEERHRHHLSEVVRSLLIIAKERSLFITALCNLPSRSSNKLNEDLDAPEALLMMISEPDDEQRKTSSFVDIAERAYSNLSTLNAALQEVDALIPQDDRRALARSQILFGCGYFEAAWLEVDPHLDSFQDEYPAIYLNLGQFALAAMKPEHATKFLNLAVASGIFTFGELYTAYILSNKLDQSSTSDAILRQMKQYYPNEKATLDLEYKEALHARNYIVASNISQKLNLDFETELWIAFSKPILELEALDKLASELGKHDQFAAAAAEECSARGDLSAASFWAKMVSPESKFEAEAVRIRIRAFGNGLLSTLNLGEDDVEELIPLLVYVAHNPTEQSVRFALDTVFEETLDGMNALILLQTAFSRLIPTSVPYGLEVPPTNSFTEAEIDTAIAFATRAFATLGTPTLALGYGRLPEELRQDVTARLLHSLVFVIQESKFSDDSPQHG